MIMLITLKGFLTQTRIGVGRGTFFLTQTRIGVGRGTLVSKGSISGQYVFIMTKSGSFLYMFSFSKYM